MPNREEPAAPAGGEATRFQPGRSGNPAGYSKGRRIAARLMAQLEATDGGVDEFLRLGVEAARHGDYRYWSYICDRIDDLPDDSASADGEDADALREALDLLRRFNPGPANPGPGLGG